MVEERNEAAMTKLATGRARTAFIHLVKPGDNGEEKVELLCGRTLNRSTAIVAEALKFPAGDRRPCRDCRAFWPETLVNYMNE